MASASRWLPPATRWLGSGSNAATCSRTSAESRSAPSAEEISTRARTASAAAEGRPAAATTSATEAAGPGAAAPPPDDAAPPPDASRFGGRPRHRSARLLQLLRGQLHPARLAHVVAHAGVGQLEPEPLRERAHHLVAREHELGAALDHRATHAVRPHAAADPVAGLEDAHVDAAVGELERRREARVARPDDRDPAQNSRQWGSDFAMSTQTTQ